jgi:hypothetical protein
MKNISIHINCILFSILVTTSWSYSQTIERSTFVAAAGYSSGSGVSLQSNIGELLVETDTQSQTILSQGFIQPDLISTTSIVSVNYTTELKAYPNPVSGKLVVEINGSSFDELDVSVVDLLGRQQLVSIVNDQFKKGKSYEMDFEKLLPGVYFIQIVSTKNHYFQTVKINKI